VQILLRLVAWSVVLIGGAPTLLGHRLDEYLQASRIEISTAQVVIELDLTPGSAIAESVVAAIDRNHDGLATLEEARSYADDVRKSTQLELDGQRLDLRLISTQAPDPDALRSGVGTIRLRLGAGWTGTPGAHQLLYRNVHREDVSVYLANVLAPATPRIRITAQDRDVRQRELRLGYEVTAATPQWPSWWAALLGVAVLSAALWQSSARLRAGFPLLFRS
jgi:hypothetical protein